MKNILEWIIIIFIASISTLIFRYFIGTPTTVKKISMSPTLKDNDKIFISRIFRITKKIPKRGDIVTFEAPSSTYSFSNVNQSNPKAIYNNSKKGLIKKFFYNILEITKTSYIKRVIAEPGEHVEIKNGNVYINGNKLQENYLAENITTESFIFNDFIVPEGYLFCMGDNRPDSIDCRNFGCIPFKKIEGKVICRFWPLNK